MNFPDYYEKSYNIQEKGYGNTALHLAMSFQQRKVLQLLLSHPRIMMYLLNKRLQDPEECAKKIVLSI
ncbi:ankyrin repeat domain-containing protein [Wolbachia endosymbiont of Frankliniella intonsa]|uniref:hypothetical protein n=1 Tax=Wolbachia endosymbiont of Frankliniella intonsa TaxID=2902422 RepID=UPI00244EFE1A|nr:hypothetical protein [Wolbachia endosymbiont of Frankliniella intonsa]WGJ61755.1 ankyrin repeat domain-containing protein [Wolbachia endosymbiont of Frankliniella intonsa]